MPDFQTNTAPIQLGHLANTTEHENGAAQGEETWIIFTLLIEGSITPASTLFLTTPLIKSKPDL
jgi:hypothetical protein